MIQIRDDIPIPPPSPKRSTKGEVRNSHGETSKGKRTSEYRAWQDMKRRCISVNNKDYHNYGGRGITVCERWLNSYENFLIDMGRKPSKKHSLDRFPNNDGNYEPSNCRWATEKEQALNRRNIPNSGRFKKTKTPTLEFEAPKA